MSNSGRDWSLIGRIARRIGANLAALSVAGVAARSTWDHIVEVARRYGEPMAVWLPISVDGMMLVGVIMAADARAEGRPVGWPARVATWLGGLLSVGAQIESGRMRGWVAALIAMVPSLTLIIAVETLFWRGKAKAKPEPQPQPVPESPEAIAYRKAVEQAKEQLRRDSAIAAMNGNGTAPVQSNA